MIKAPKLRFRRKAIRGYRATSEPTAGELKSPISIYTSKRTPNENAGYDRLLTCYATPFSKFEPASARWMGGENADQTSTHLFTIRWDGRLTVSVGDYVLCNKRFYKVQFTTTFGTMNDWLTLYTAEHFPESSSENFVIATERQAPPTVEPGTHNAGFDIPE